MTLGPRDPVGDLFMVAAAITHPADRRAGDGDLGRAVYGGELEHTLLTAFGVARCVARDRARAARGRSPRSPSPPRATPRVRIGELRGRARAASLGWAVARRSPARRVAGDRHAARGGREHRWPLIGAGASPRLLTLCVLRYRERRADDAARDRRAGPALAAGERIS